MLRRRTGAGRSSHILESGPLVLCAMSGTPLRDVRVLVHDVRHPVTRCSGACARCQAPRYAMHGCLCAMSGTPLRDARVLVRDVRHPVTRCTGACARCQTPRYAMHGCLCAMSDTPLRDVRVLVRDVGHPVSCGDGQIMGCTLAAGRAGGKVGAAGPPRPTGQFTGIDAHRAPLHSDHWHAASAQRRPSRAAQA